MKKLTLAITGRNDNYNPFFLSRLSYCLNFASFSLQKLGLEEFVRFSISDWGSEKKLKDVLQLTKSTSKIIDFFETSQNIAKKNSFEEDRFFSNAKAHNIAIRRSKTDFIAFTSHDYIMNQLFFLNLYNLLNKKIFNYIDLKNSFFVVPRKTLPDELFKFTPSFEYLEDWLNKTSELKSDLSVKHGGAGGAYLTSKKNWEKLGGIDERYRKWGVLEYDLFSRASLIGKTYETSKLGIWQFKLPRGDAKVRAKSIKDINKKWFDKDLHPNNKNWGLNEIKILRKTNNKNILNFNFDKKIIKYKKSKKESILFNYLKTLHKIYLIKCPLRVKYISIEQIILLNLIHAYIGNYECRTINFIGYENFFIPSFLTFKDKTINFNVLDDIDLLIKNIDNANLNKMSLQRGDLIFKRSIHLQEILMATNHLGYVSFINNNFDKNIKNYFTKLSNTNFSNIILVDSNLLNLKNIDSFINQLELSFNKISLIILYNLDKKNTKIISKLQSKNYNFEELLSNIYIIKNKSARISNFYSNSNIVNLFLLFITNIMYFTYMFLRLITNRIIKRILLK